MRAFRTRSLATDACRAGSVDVNGQQAKPAREVRAGETVTLRSGLITRTLLVLAIPANRLGAARVPAFCEDRTPTAEYEKAKEHRVQQLLARERGSGRPTKRDRRAIDRLLGM